MSTSWSSFFVLGTTYKWCWLAVALILSSEKKPVFEHYSCKEMRLESKRNLTMSLRILKVESVILKRFDCF